MEQSFPNNRPRALELAGHQAETAHFLVLGIAATTIGTVLAVSFIPENPEPEGALFSSALLMAAGLAAAPFAAGFRNPKSLLRGENLLALAPIYWLLLDLIQGAYSLDWIQPDEVEKAFIGIGLFVVAMWAAACLRPWKVPSGILRSVSQMFSSNTYFGFTVVAFLLGMLKFAIPTNFDLAEMIYYVGQDRWAAPWARGQLGGRDAFVDQLQYFGYLLPALTVVVARCAGWFNPRTLLCSGMSAVMAVFLAQSGSRRIIGVIFGMAFILWILTQNRTRPRHVLILAIAGAALLMSLQTMLEYRQVGLAELVKGGKGDTDLTGGYLRVDDNFFRFCQIIGLIPEYYPFVYHEYVLWVLVRPIPRVFWPGKPVEPGFDLPTAVGVKGVTLSSSVIGELYMSAGFIGIALGGWLYGRLSGMATLLLRQGSYGAILVYSNLMMALFCGMRSMVELVLVNYAVLAWVGLSRLVILTKKRL